MKITDEIGSNLSFVDNSFKVVDKTGATVPANLNVSYEGQKATISLGDLSAGDYYVQYKTRVNQTALDNLKDNEDLSNVSNTIKWSWGTTNPQESGPKSADPQNIRYNLVTKSADGSSTSNRIKWVVKLNNGSLKADMSDYKFTDDLGSDQTFTSDSVTVTDESNATVEVGNLTKSDSSLSFTLPSDAGKKSYTVTYYTTMTNTQSKDAVSNTAKVTPPDGSKYPSGEGTGTYTPKDNGTYITKALTSTVDSDSYNGTAEWKSEILFSDMAAGTSADKIVFSDWFTALPSGVTVKLDGDVTVKVDGGDTLEAGTDYELTNNGEKGQWKDIFTITFKATDKVKALIGKAAAKVVVTYKTQTSAVDGTYPSGTYTNQSKVKTDKKSDVTASASYDIESSKMPAVSKKTTGNATWDAAYDWGNGEKGAWITEWEAHVNCEEPNNWTHQAAGDLKGADVKLTDTLPEGMEYVANSGKYTLYNNNNGSAALWEKAVTPTVTGNQAVFTVTTFDVSTNTGTEENPVYSWKGYVVFKYKTAVKASAIEAGATKEFENTAQAESGEKNFPAGTAKTTITNNVLDKTAARASDDSHVTFTINVNPNALTLGTTGSLELEDVMNSGASFTSGTLHVKDKATGAEVTEGFSYKLSNGTASDGSSTTTLNLTVPDSRALVVTYDVSPQGNLGDQVFISNDVSMMGFASASKNYGQCWQVAKSNAGTEGTSYGLTISKTDDSGNKALEGAVFELYFVDLDNSTRDNIKKSLVTGVGENPKTTGADGTVSFGTKDNPLDANKLYCYVETKAPAGYKISNTEPSYVMFSGTSDQDKTDFAAALAKAKELGITPTIGTSVSVYDSLADGTFKLHVNKDVSGSYKADAAPTFTFTATATGDNDEQAPALSDVTITGAGQADFEGELTKEMIGQTFIYDLKEVVPDEARKPAGWTYDGGTIQASVKVVSDGEKISAEVSYSKDGQAADTAQFSNEYKATGTAIVNVVKQVNGAEPAADAKFTFKISSDNAEAASKLPDTTTVTTTGADVACFGALAFNQEDAGRTYTYTIKETSELGSGWTKASDVTVTVKVGADKGDGTLEASTVEYDNKTTRDSKTAALFNNKYEAATTSAKLGVTKKVNGKDDIRDNEKFTFELQDKDGNKLADATVDSGHHTASFGAQTYDKADTYEYNVHETSMLGDGWTNASDQKVYVSVEADKNGNLSVTSVTYGDKKETITAGTTGEYDLVVNNTYEASTSATIKVNKKVVGGTDATKDESFDFSLYQAGDYTVDEDGNVTKGTQVGKTISVKADGTASFDALEYSYADVGNTYSYVIHEVGHRTDGWTAAADINVTVEVIQAADRTLSTKVTYSNPNADKTAALFTNIYSTTGEATIQVYKTVNGGTEAKKDEKFTFDLYKADADGNAEGEKLATVETKAGEVASFSTVKFTETGIYNYVVKETGHNDGGWTAAADVKATVKVTDNGKGGLTASVEYSNTKEGAAGFDNEYKATGSATINVEKTVNGGSEAAEGESFTFQLFKADEDGEAAGDVIDTVNVKAGETKSFDAKRLGYTFDDTGKTFTYVIHEDGHNTDGWFAASDVTATVKVSDNNDGTLKAEVTYSNANKAKDAALFDNVKSTASADLKLYKTVNDGPIAEGEKFTFTLLDKDNKQLGAEKTADAKNQFVTFDQLTFDKEGTYTYTIHETTELADGWTNDADVAVTVKVERDEASKTLKVTSIDYGDRAYEKDGQVMAHFDDKYLTSVDAGIEVNKKVNGGTDAVAGETFDFTLTNEAGETLSEAHAKAGETVAFEGVKYTTADADKTFRYTIHEVGHNDKGWTADSDVKVTVTVAQNADRTLKVERTYSRGTNAAEFTNAYATSGEATIQVSKTVNGGAYSTDKEFEFGLYETDAEGNKTGEPVSTVKVRAGETAAFGGVFYDGDNAGETVTYVVSELGDLGDGWTKAADQKVAVKVIDNGDGTMKATVDYGAGKTALAFDNTYEATGTATIAVTKTVNGGTEAAPNEDFTFDLYEGDKAEGQPVDTVSVKANGTASFSKLGFDLTDAGKEFTYAVHETGHNTDGWVADSDVKATVKVTDNGDGTLSAEVTYSRGTNAAAFDDKYDTEATATISVSKTVNGGTDAVAGEWFEFELLDQDGKKVEGTQAVKAQAGDTASFSALSYSLADAGKEFKYTVHEVGHNDKGWTADSDVDVTVKVVKNADLTLSTEVTYGRGANAAEFTNTYATAGKLKLNVAKTVNGGAYSADKEFEFGLYETDAEVNKTGEPVSTVKVRAGETAAFGGVFYDNDNAGETVTYVVSELGDLGDGWTKAADQKVTVKVTDNGDGTMKATVNYGTGKTALAFDNKYEQPTTGKKTTTTTSKKSGNTPKTGDPATVTFVLVAAAGLALVANGLRRRRVN